MGGGPTKYFVLDTDLFIKLQSYASLFIFFKSVVIISIKILYAAN